MEIEYENNCPTADDLRGCSAYLFPKKADRLMGQAADEIEKMREIISRLQNCASALLGWHSDSMSIEQTRIITETLRDAENILSNTEITSREATRPKP